MITFDPREMNCSGVRRWLHASLQNSLVLSAVEQEAARHCDDCLTCFLARAEHDEMKRMVRHAIRRERVPDRLGRRVADLLRNNPPPPWDIPPARRTL